MNSIQKLRRTEIGINVLDGVHFYTRLKTVTARWPQDVASTASFVMPTH